MESFSVLVIVASLMSSYIQTPTPLEHTIDDYIEGTAEEGKYVLDENSGCKVYNPFPTAVQSMSWSGACKDGFSDGKGRMEWVYTGGIKEVETIDTYHKKGKYTGPIETITYNIDGKEILRSKASVFDNAHHGYGTYSKPSGVRFEGNFKNGFVSGYGKLVIKNTDDNYEDLTYWKEQNVGKLVGDEYVIEGLFKGRYEVTTECQKDTCPTE